MSSTDNWACGVCTFSNQNTNLKCEMCDNPHKPSQQQAISNNNQNDKQPVDNSAEKNWTCAQCTANNNHTHLFCAACGFKKGYDPSTDPRNVNQNKPKKQSNINNNINNNDQPFYEAKEVKEAPAQVMNSDNYNIGDKVLYPKTYIELENKLAQYKNSKNYPSPQQNPSKYSLACILSMDKINSTFTITDIISNDKKNISIHSALISTFNLQQYETFRRGTSISFYDEAKQDWNQGRIESIIDTTQYGIQYGKDSWIMVPIYYVKEFEELKEDEWTAVSDFVFKEYVRDVATELAQQSMNSSQNLDADTMIDPNKFRAAMERLGIKSLTSRTKAFTIFEQLKKEIIVQQIAKQKKKHAGRIMGEYKCIACHLLLQADGICLTNCKHQICKADFQNILSDVVKNRAQRLLKCPQCFKEINPIDIERHGTTFQLSIITQMQLDQVQYTFDATVCLSCGGKNDKMDGLLQYSCMHCGVDNCLQCKAQHGSDITCDEYKYGNHKFRKQWVHNHKQNKRYGAVLTDVVPNSKEWNDIISDMKYSAAKVMKISRIEHEELWKKYYEYSQSLGFRLAEVRVWHGTRATNPSLIYSNGFLKEKSRIGGCLWYAVDSNYSMNGFQHPVGNGESQLFLCLVAGGNNFHVKYIRNNKILNVYKNEATYPAYLITYK